MFKALRIALMVASIALTVAKINRELKATGHGSSL